MNLTEARKIARNHLRYGRMRESGTTSYVYCPRCRERITAHYPAWFDSKPAKIEAELERAIVEHLHGRYADCATTTKEGSTP